MVFKRSLVDEQVQPIRNRNEVRDVVERFRVELLRNFVNEQRKLVEEHVAQAAKAKPRLECRRFGDEFMDFLDGRLVVLV